jgi:hypothetical protein
MKRLGAGVLVLALAALPLCAADRDPSDTRADDEAFAQKLLEIIEKTCAQADETSLDKTPPGTFDGEDGAVCDEIAQRLDSQRLSLNFEETGFADAIDFLRDATGLNIVLSQKAKELTENAPKLKLKLKDVKTRNALELVLTQTDPQLRYGVKHGVLSIGVNDDWKDKNLILDVIEVKDLVYRPPDFPAPQAGLDALEKGNKWKK